MINHRIEKGLLPEGECHNKDKLPDPTTNWVDNPKFVSKSLLVEKRADELMNDQKKFEPFFETHINGQGRIEERENCIARLAYKGLHTTSYNNETIKKRRIKENIDDMTKKFGAQVLGVHGCELPKF